MAQVIRESVVAPPDGISAAPFLLLTGWAVAGILLATWMMARRT
jgi:ABC-2 type transport system permease protein